MVEVPFGALDVGTEVLVMPHPYKSRPGVIVETTFHIGLSLPYRVQIDLDGEKHYSYFDRWELALVDAEGTTHIEPQPGENPLGGLA